MKESAGDLNWLDVKGFDLTKEYQGWYSKALSVVSQTLPLRVAEFKELYRPTNRKTLDADTHGIADAVLGLSVNRLGAPVSMAVP
jgi:hypothetical protein